MIQLKVISGSTANTHFVGKVCYTSCRVPSSLIFAHPFFANHAVSARFELADVFPRRRISSAVPYIHSGPTHLGKPSNPDWFTFHHNPHDSLWHAVRNVNHPYI